MPAKQATTGHLQSLPGRCVPHAAQQGKRLPPASAPDVPFCAVATRATVVVLARCSAPNRVRSIADSGAVGATCSTICQVRFSMPCSRDRRPPVLALVAAPGTAL
jgi:hypothetical protein